MLLPRIHSAAAVIAACVLFGAGIGCRGHVRGLVVHPGRRLDRIHGRLGTVRRIRTGWIQPRRMRGVELSETGLRSEHSRRGYHHSERASTSAGPSPPRPLRPSRVTACGAACDRRAAGRRLHLLGARVLPPGGRACSIRQHGFGVEGCVEYSDLNQCAARGSPGVPRYRRKPHQRRSRVEVKRLIATMECITDKPRAVHRWRAPDSCRSTERRSR